MNGAIVWIHFGNSEDLVWIRFCENLSTCMNPACLWPWFSSGKVHPNSINKLFCCGPCLCLSCSDVCVTLWATPCVGGVGPVRPRVADRYRLHQPCFRQSVNISGIMENRATITIINFLSNKTCVSMIWPLVLFEISDHLSSQAKQQPLWWLSVYNSSQAPKGGDWEITIARKE